MNFKYEIRHNFRLLGGDEADVEPADLLQLNPFSSVATAGDTIGCIAGQPSSALPINTGESNESREAVKDRDDQDRAESLQEGNDPGFIPLSNMEDSPVRAETAPSGPETPLGGYLPPWLPSCRYLRSPSLRLHQEVINFCKMLSPTEQETRDRQGAVDDVTAVVTSIWKEARVEVFGSFLTGLYTPNSDIDLVIMGPRSHSIQDSLRALAKALTVKGLAQNVQVIAKAKVPIIKFESIPAGIAFDVSFEAANGPQAAALVQKFVRTWPAMKPLVLLLKVFLQQRELNEVYQGGIGSYALITMILAFLQLHRSRWSEDDDGGGEALPPEGNLGVLLVDFFRLYGRVLNTQEVGVSAREGGTFFNKGDRKWVVEQRRFLLALEDPNDVTNDVGRNSYNIQKVRQAFDFAYQALTTSLDDPRESLLARIIRLEDIVKGRLPPEWVNGESNTSRKAERHHHRHHNSSPRHPDNEKGQPSRQLHHRQHHHEHWSHGSPPDELPSRHHPGERRRSAEAFVDREEKPGRRKRSRSSNSPWGGHGPASDGEPGGRDVWDGPERQHKKPRRGGENGYRRDVRYDSTEMVLTPKHRKGVGKDRDWDAAFVDHGYGPRGPGKGGGQQLSQGLDELWSGGMGGIDFSGGSARGARHQKQLPSNRYRNGGESAFEGYDSHRQKQSHTDTGEGKPFPRGGGTQEAVDRQYHQTFHPYSTVSDVTILSHEKGRRRKGRR